MDMSKLVIAEVATGKNKRQKISKRILEVLIVIGLIMFAILLFSSIFLFYKETRKYINQNSVSDQILLDMVQQYTIHIAIFSIIIVAVTLLIKGLGTATTIIKKIMKVIKYYVISFCISFISIILGVVLYISSLNNWQLNIGILIYILLLITFFLMYIISSETIKNAKRFIFKNRRRS